MAEAMAGRMVRRSRVASSRRTSSRIRGSADSHGSGKRLSGSPRRSSAPSTVRRKRWPPSTTSSVSSWRTRSASSTTSSVSRRSRRRCGRRRSRTGMASQGRTFRHRRRALRSRRSTATRPPARPRPPSSARWRWRDHPGRARTPTRGARGPLPGDARRHRRARSGERRPKAVGLVYPTEFTEDLPRAPLQEVGRGPGRELVLGSPTTSRPRASAPCCSTCRWARARHYKTDWWASDRASGTTTRSPTRSRSPSR